MRTQRHITPEWWRVVEPLLDAALDADAPDRADLINAACGDDKQLHAQVTQLLTACDEGSALLAEPAVFRYEPLLAGVVPRTLGDRYHIVREIARGGMGTVYVADDPRHGRQVAVKVLHAHVAEMIGRDRFLREIGIAARLSHPHILPLHDSGEAAIEDGDTVLYYVSPFIVGESLRGRMQRAPRLPVDEIVRLGREVALALDYAHRQGVVHLDIKPENILLQDGHAIVCDFGIAHAIDDAPPPDAGPFLGTPAYMSPEHTHRMHDIDGRSDVYSLGCVLREMLADTPDRNARGVRRITRAVARATAPAREDRFASAAELAMELTAALAPAGGSEGGDRMWTGLVAAVLAVAGVALLLYVNAIARA